MTNFTWSILSMSVMPVLEGESDVVVSAQWSLQGTQTVTEITTEVNPETQESVEIVTDKQYFSTLNGQQNFKLSNKEQFTPYNLLTPEQVIGWVKDTMGESGVASMEAAVQGQLDSLINPPVTPQEVPLPWTN